MSPPKILDTHIHLWPSTATSSTDHGWMTPGIPLAKQHGITDYSSATSSSPIQPSGFVYVETDRYLPSPSPQISAEDDAESSAQKIKQWAKAPLEELAFLRRIVEAQPQEGDGFTAEDSKKIKGLVTWAPFHLPPSSFDTYLQLAYEELGTTASEKVVGFRYLLQGRDPDEIFKLAPWNKSFIENLIAVGRGAGPLGGRAMAFDIGVDCHRDGVKALAAMELLLEKVKGLPDTEESRKPGRQQIRFVLNHLCKPDLSIPSWPDFSQWKSSIAHLSSDPNVYMKLSGALNEFASPTPSSPAAILDALRPYLDHILQVFGPKRVMFGSDWPVCNVGGPKGEQGNWEFWRQIVEMWMEEKGLGDEEREWVWWRAGAEAYGISDI